MKKSPFFMPGDIAVVGETKYDDDGLISWRDSIWAYDGNNPLFIIKENTIVLIVSSDWKGHNKKLFTMVFVVCNGQPVEVLAEHLKVLK